MEFQIRQARLPDRDAIVAFHLALYIDHRERVVPPEQTELYAYRRFSEVLRHDVDAMLRNPSTTILLAEQSGQPVGYVTGYVTLDARRVLQRKGVIGDWFVLPEVRGEGVGRQLLDALLGMFSDQQCDLVETMTWPGNTGAQGAFERAGFQPVQVTYRKRIRS